MTEEDLFFRFPHTPHLAWLGQDRPRGDKVLSRAEAQGLLSGEVVVEEKLDGANLGFSIGPDGRLRAQNRGQYLSEPYAGQFSRLPGWLAWRGEALRQALDHRPGLHVFGEWCAARHSLDYVRLPDWFLVFDVHERPAGRFWSRTRRNAWAASAGLACVPLLTQGQCTLSELTQQVNTGNSRYRNGPMEGVIVRRDSALWCEDRAKLVRADFTQAIGTHWRQRPIEWNRISA